MKKYVWIRLYIAISTVLAAIVALLFIGGFLLLIVQYKQNVEETSYRENSKVADSLNEARSSYLHTDFLILQFESASGLSRDSLPTVESFAGHYDNDVRLKDALSKIQKMQMEVQALKDSLFSKIESRWTTFVESSLNMQQV